jgi:hypothetical protein
MIQPKFANTYRSEKKVANDLDALLGAANAIGTGIVREEGAGHESGVYLSGGNFLGGNPWRYVWYLDYRNFWTRLQLDISQ